MVSPDENRAAKPGELAWACIACTLARGEVIGFNTAPENKMNNQSRDHLVGKKHKQALKRMGHTLFSEDNVRKFLSLMGKDYETLREGNDPVETIKVYTEMSGGNPEYAIGMMPPPPPPIPGTKERMRIKKVTRAVMSSAYCPRKEDPQIVTKMACCWDDSGISLR